MTTKERLEKLERELARAKRLNRRMVLAGAGLLLGMFALLLVGRSMTSVAQGQEETARKKVIWANEFVLLDDRGRERGRLHMLKNGPSLSLYDEKGGKPRVILSTPGLMLLDENGKLRVGLAVGDNDPGLMLSDENGKLRTVLAVGKDGQALAMRDENGNPRAGLAVTKDGASLALFDEDATNRVLVGVSQTETPDGKVITYNWSLLLFGPDGKAIWQAP